MWIDRCRYIEEEDNIGHEPTKHHEIIVHTFGPSQASSPRGVGCHILGMWNNIIYKHEAKSKNDLVTLESRLRVLWLRCIQWGKNFVSCTAQCVLWPGHLFIWFLILGVHTILVVATTCMGVNWVYNNGSVCKQRHSTWVGWGRVRIISPKDNFWDTVQLFNFQNSAFYVGVGFIISWNFLYQYCMGWPLSVFVRKLLAT